MSRGISFDKDISTSPGGTIPATAKEIKEKPAEISSDSHSESDLELE